MSTCWNDRPLGDLCAMPTFSPMKSIGASSRSPSPITIVPSIGTVSMTRRMASTATASEWCRSPCPIVWAHAMAASSTTRRKSSERSESSIRRQLAAGWPVRPVAEQVIGLHQFVNLTRAFVDHRTLAVAIKTPHRVLVRVSVRAVNLHGIGGRALGGDSREPFRESRFPGVAPAGVLQPSRTHPEQPRRLIVGFHLREHFFHELVGADFGAKGFPLLRVAHARVAACADEARCASRNGIPSLIQREHRDLEALTLATDQVFLRHVDFVHLKQTGVAGQNSPLFFQGAARESLERAFDDERADAVRVALLLLLQIAPREDEEVVRNVGERNPHLLAGDDKSIALLDGDGLNAARIASCRRLG